MKHRAFIERMAKYTSIVEALKTNQPDVVAKEFGTTKRGIAVASRFVKRHSRDVLSPALADLSNEIAQAYPTFKTIDEVKQWLIRHYTAGRHQRGVGAPSSLRKIMRLTGMEHGLLNGDLVIAPKYAN